MVTCKRKGCKLKSSLMLIPNSISKNAEMKFESFKVSSLTQCIIFLINTFWWRQMWQFGVVQNIRLSLLCNKWWSLALFVRHFFHSTRFTHDYSSSAWFFVLFIVWSINIYNLLGVYMEAYKSCGNHKLLVMEVIMMSLNFFLLKSKYISSSPSSSSTLHEILMQFMQSSKATQSCQHSFVGL
jgi:hypothetical protein